MLKLGINQIMYFGIITLWMVGVIIYFLYLRKEWSRRLREEREENAKRKQRRGKKCPNCKNIISIARPVCQHCGYQFPDLPAAMAENPGQPLESHGSGRKRRRGKKCPNCKNIINYYREVCQHCGYKFGAVETPSELQDKDATS